MNHSEEIIKNIRAGYASHKSVLLGNLTRTKSSQQHKTCIAFWPNGFVDLENLPVGQAPAFNKKYCNRSGAGGPLLVWDVKHSPNLTMSQLDDLFTAWLDDKARSLGSRGVELDR
jgi:hypothetical protein